MGAEGIVQGILSSSAAVCGLPAADLVGEDAAPQPVNPFGVSKLACERIIADAARPHGLRHVILRYFNVAGAGVTGRPRPADAGLMESALDAVARGDRPLVFGGDYPTADGTCVRDFVHVLDVASAHALAVDALESGSGSAVYNVGCGTGPSVLQVLDRIREVTRIDFVTESRPRPGADPHPA